MQTQSSSSLSFDISGVQLSEARTSLLKSVQRLADAQPFAGSFWDLFLSGSRDIPSRMLVVSDLSTLARNYQSLDYRLWVSAVRRLQPYFVALMRTKSDAHVADLVGDLFRHSDLRITFCKHLKGKELERCLARAVGALGNDALLDVRYLAILDQIWVAFGDGLSGMISWESLQMDDVHGEIIPESAVVGSLGLTVEFLMQDGNVFEIDAASIRSILDADCAAKLAGRALDADLIVGQRIRAARLKAGLSQEELGERSGIDQAILSKLERGKHQPRVDTLRRIGKGLGLTLAEFLVPVDVEVG